MRADIVPGAVFPDYELSDHTANRRKLSELQGPHPMVLVLSRGGFCPKDRRQSELLVQLHREMEVGYSRLVTISTDSISETNGLVVFKVYNGYWFWGRPTLEDLRQDLRIVTKKCRPDWDITDAEHKAAWQRGETDRFYPYGKSYAKVFGEQD
jgi:hypothetical protein